MTNGELKIDINSSPIDTLTWEKLREVYKKVADSTSAWRSAYGITSSQINSSTLPPDWENESQNQFFDSKKIEAAREKPKIVRKHKIKDLVLAEITKAKLKNYDKAQSINYIMLGLKDFCDFIQQENLGRISDWMDEINLIWNNYNIRCVKEEDRKIEISYLSIVDPFGFNVNSMNPWISPNTTYIYGSGKSGKSLYMKTLKNRYNSKRGMSSTIYIDEYATINPKV
jgi:hypothetical protein